MYKLKVIIKSKLKMNKSLDICMFLAVFLASMAGTLIFGVSINKVGLIPLIVYMVMRQGISRQVRIPLRSPLLLYYAFGMLSCVFALTHTSKYQYSGYVEDMVFFVLQRLLFYIPLFILIYNDKDKQELHDSFCRMLVLTCRIQMLFGLIQLIAYSTIRFDIARFIDTNYMKGFLTVDGVWTCIFYDEQGLSIRPCGFTNVPNFFAILLTLGFVLDKNRVYRLLYAAMVFLSSTRTCVLVLLLVLLIYATKFLKTRTYSINKLFLGCVLFLTSIIGMIYIYESNVFVRNQVITLLRRFDFISGNISQSSASSKNHIMYYPYGLKVFAEDMNILEKLIGSGPRASGLMLQLNQEVSAALNLHNDFSWELECDIMGILIGNGLFGLILYYITLYHLFKNNRERAMAILVVVFTGIFYATESLTTIALMYIVFSAAPEQNLQSLQVLSSDLKQATSER